MLRNLLRAFITALGSMAIPGVIMLMQTMYKSFAQKDLFASLPAWGPLVVYLLAGACSAALFYWLSGGISTAIENGVSRLESKLRDAPSISLLSGGIGLILGLIVAALFSVVISLIPVAWVSVPLTIIFYIIFGYLGAVIGIAHRKDVSNYFTSILSRGDRGKAPEASPKLLDTSAIIDGRIFDVVRAGVFDSAVVVPSFVLEELKRVAASQDSAKRARGRRGLELLGQIQKDMPSSIRIAHKEIPQDADIDVWLIKLARELGGKVVTTDYSLNKIAQVQDIQVFNINELANALKPACTAGERLKVRIDREGREQGQGVGYMEDGTMIVVEQGASYVASTLDVIVTSVLQTPAGRMLFAKPAPESRSE